MKTKFVLCLVTFMLLIADATASDVEVFVRNKGESLTAFAIRTLPSGVLIAHQPLELAFGPSNKNIVVLYQKERYRGLSGFILVPDKQGYKKYLLPQLEVPLSTEVTAVFTENFDKDPKKELIILCDHITGYGLDGTTPYSETYVIDWDGNQFVHTPWENKPISDTTENAREVRSLIKAKKK